MKNGGFSMAVGGNPREMEVHSWNNHKPYIFSMMQTDANSFQLVTG